MEKTGYYIYPTVPGSMDALRWDSHGRTIKDVTVSSAEVEKYGIAEMTLNATSVAAVADDTSEHTILTFKNQYQIKLHGVRTGRSTRTDRIMKLAPGVYTHLRFYLNGKVSYLSASREEHGIFGLDAIDFELEQPITIEGNESVELVIRFNFVPFESKSWFKSLRQPKPVQWPSAKWA